MAASVMQSLQLAVLVLVSLVYISMRLLRMRTARLQGRDFTIGFFHPHCNSGGGGERVLWQYVRILQQSAPDVRLLVYTGDAESAEDILAKTKDRFGLTIDPARVKFVRLRLRRLAAAESWPRFTLLGQSLGSIVLACEALLRAPASLFIDSTGFAFTYPVARLAFGAHVHCYTHYPTISSDMLAVVFARRPAHNNSAAVSRSAVLARAKWIYYRAFSFAYSLAGRAAHLVFVNSTWTRGHIDAMWGLPAGRVHTVYPPCDTKTLQQIPLGIVQPWVASTTDNQAATSSGLHVREPMIMSLAQFRPEKDHTLQLRAFALFLERMRALAAERGVPPLPVKLALLGGVRDAGDEARVAELRTLARELGIADRVLFELNRPADVVHSYLRRSVAALHTMWNEHFGIGVVEFMAAGVIPIAHDSGGPALDIVVRYQGHPTGYRACDAESYATALCEVFCSELTGSADMQLMREKAREYVSKSFSDEVFEEQINKILMPFIKGCQAEGDETIRRNMKRPAPQQQQQQPQRRSVAKKSN